MILDQVLQQIGSLLQRGLGCIGSLQGGVQEGQVTEDEGQSMHVVSGGMILTELFVDLDRAADNGHGLFRLALAVKRQGNFPHRFHESADVIELVRKIFDELFVDHALLFECRVCKTELSIVAMDVGAVLVRPGQDNRVARGFGILIDKSAADSDGLVQRLGCLAELTHLPESTPEIVVLVGEAAGVIG